MKILDLAVVGAFAGGVAGALIGASTMFAVDVLVPSTAAAQLYQAGSKAADHQTVIVLL